MNYEVMFESDRIYFIKLTEQLVQDYLEMVNDKDVQRFITNTNNTYSLDSEMDWIKKKIESNAIIFSMIEKSTNEFIGNIEIMDKNNSIGTLGISITPKKQDMHYGQEAIKRILDYSFNELNLNEVHLNVYNFNPRGIRCYEKVGFVKDGLGKTVDEIHMKIKK